AWSHKGLSSVAAEAGPEAPPIADVVQPMPRRTFVHKFDDAAVTPPMAHRGTFRPGVVYPLGRLFVWVRGFLYFFFGNAVRIVHRRDSLQRRAVRLRRQFEAAGGSFGKLAQQLAQRPDLLPYAYCEEFSKMLDRAPAFPVTEAITIIEQSLGKSLGDVFEIFD